MLTVVEFSECETYAMRCTIWYQLRNLKLENYPCSSVTFSKVACNFTKSNTPSWVFFTFSKFYKWYQIAQSITYIIPLIFHLQPQQSGKTFLPTPQYMLFLRYTILLLIFPYSINSLCLLFLKYFCHALSHSSNMCIVLLSIWAGHHYQ